MTVEFAIKVAGLLKATDTAAVFYGRNVTAVAVNKSIVVTTGDPMEFISDDITYITSNLERGDVDEVVDLSDAGIDNEDDTVHAVQSVAQMALLVSEPGPVAVKFLERVVAEDDFAARQVTRSQGKLAKKATVKPQPKAKSTAKATKGNVQTWYKAKDGKGFTTDPTQARMYAGKPVLAKGNVSAA